MRNFVVSILLVLLAIPAAAQGLIDLGPNELEGKLIHALAPSLVFNAGKFGASALPIQGATPELDAELKKQMTAEREWPEKYDDVPTVKLRGEVQVVSGRRLFLVAELVRVPGSDQALLALEHLTAAVEELEAANQSAMAKAVAAAAIPLARNVAAAAGATDTAPRARAVLRRLQGWMDESTF